MNNKKVKSRTRKPKLNKKSKKQVKNSSDKKKICVKINKVDDPILLKFGYNNNNSSDDRKYSLSNAVIILGPDNLKKKLDLLQSKYSETVFRIDKEWVDGKYKK